MKALVYNGVGIKGIEDCPKPKLEQPSDAIIKVIKTTICGTDLHILNGDVDSCKPGTILGHEGIGVVDSVGVGVSVFKVGDKVIISCITACARCDNCRKGMYSQCESGGWMLGNTINGTQAEFVRIPYADTSLYHIPESLDEETYVMLSDILPTGFECGVLNGKVQVGGVVVIVGAGPIGLAALLTAQFYSPSQIIMVDLDDGRLEISKKFGATSIVNSAHENVIKKIMELTSGKGADTAIEAVGIPETFALCTELIAAGGVVANVGVHGCKVDLHLEKLWSHNITIKTGLVDTFSIPMLLKTVVAKRIKPQLFITHHFKFDQILDAYTTFNNASKTKALKVIIEI